MSADGGPSADDLDQTKPGWYLALMAPNVKGPPLAWLDPSRLYGYPKALKQCVQDLTDPFADTEIDAVVGIDAMGFILGAAIANHLNKGLVAIRKAGHLCVTTDTEDYADYQKHAKKMEMRIGAFVKGTRLLIVDQWVETGGTMTAAVRLAERHGAVIVGIAAICVEDTAVSAEMKTKYKVVHCVTDPQIQQQVNNHYLDSFKLFNKQ